jgi:hypothetical protein
MRTPAPNLARALAITLALGLALVVSPAGAYTVYLKDGSTIIAKEEHRVEGKRAIITLPNGTETFIEVSEIDLPRTERMNRNVHGTAVILEDGKLTALPKETAKEPEPTLTDLAKGRDLRPPARTTRSGSEPGGAARTPGGFIDLATLTGRPYRNLEAASTLKLFLNGQGFDEVQVSQGSEEDRPLVEITTNSEASVFRGLKVAANALLKLRETSPEITGLEVLMTTSSRERAGQFTLTPAEAASLASEAVEVTQFYLRNVEY